MSEEQLKDLLKRCEWALTMWMRTYASEEFDAQDVINAKQFLGQNGGTLGYIALLRRDIRDAVK